MINRAWKALADWEKEYSRRIRRGFHSRWQKELLHIWLGVIRFAMVVLTLLVIAGFVSLVAALVATVFFKPWVGGSIALALIIYWFGRDP